MDLKSGYPWWTVRDALPGAFPPLDADLRCDVAVIGAGITGALVAAEFAAHGHDVAVFDRREAGWGSTAASTALLQYEIDAPMRELAKRYGEEAAVLAYRACLEAIPALRRALRGLPGVAFRNADSLQYASRPAHLRALHAECRMRARHGFPVRWLDGDAVADRYGIAAPGAILSTVAASMDPYRAAWELLLRLRRRGARVHDRTAITKITPRTRDVLLATDTGLAVRARHVVVAAGYEGQAWLPRAVARNRSSYAFVSDPVAGGIPAALAGTLLWETAHPYLYLRPAGDGRLLVGGEDDRMDIPERRDRRVAGKTDRLLRKASALLPGLGLQPAFAWAGTFAETADALPCFGPHPRYGSRVLFAMAYGGNGITYAMAGAGLLRALAERRRHPLAALFGFARLQR
ncbi:MAG: NAD(P)/FAD-dependent oxidoreductase [Luteimonas sp.]